MASAAEIRNASHGDYFGIWLIFDIEFSIIYNKLNIEYKIQKTGGFVIDYLLLTIDYFLCVNLRLLTISRCLFV